MDIGMSRAISGCIIQQERLHTSTINLANANTIGFKEAHLQFSVNNDLVQVEGKSLNFTAGNKQNTANQLDLALEGKGFFTIEMPNGDVAYTRKGNFLLNQEGIIVTQEGSPVLGKKGIIRTQGGDITISADGSVKANGEEIDKLRLADFAEPYPFTTDSGTIFFPQAGAQEQPLAGTIVRQGQLELSNVNLMREMSRLIEISTNYESCQKVIQTIDEMNRKIINQTAQ